MAASVFDSPLYAQLFNTGDAGRLFSDSAAIRAMLLVEGALAKVQGSLGVIPELSAAAIHRASMEIQLDPGALAQAAGQNGVCVPGLVAAFRAEMQAPEHAQYLHWGATSQDIVDTALMLRLRQALSLVETDLIAILKTLGTQAHDHATLPMAARTFGQHATPTTWGAVCAEWGAPLLDALGGLDRLREDNLLVSLSGAAGTANALGPQAAKTRTALAKALGLGDPHRSWHTDRTPILRIVDWQGQVITALGHMAQSLIALSATDLAEVSLGGSGASSTMPQKQNPVAPSVIAALASSHAGLRATLQTASTPTHQRDGASWFAEWMVLPQLVLGLAAALQTAKSLTAGLTPRPEQMQANIAAGLGLVHAEALSFALARSLPRPQAQARTKSLCADALTHGRPLRDVVADAYPDLDLAFFEAGWGDAPAQAQAFARRALAL